MRKLSFIIAIGLSSVLLFNHKAPAQPDTQVYTLTYNGSPNNIAVDIRLPKAHKGPVQLIIPRSAPGEYGVVFWDHYLSSIKGYDSNGKEIPVIRGKGPRWIIGDSSSSVIEVTYQMDLKKMEKQELSSANSSIIRPGFVGLLDYSVFGFVHGYEYMQIGLRINAPDGWPVFTTLQPTLPLIKNSITLQVASFDLLADAQIMMGPALKVRRFNGGPVPLYVAQYAETNSSIDQLGEIGVSDMKLLKHYFTEIPFPFYTIYAEFLKPVDKQHHYDFGMEHLNSFTAFTDTTLAIKKLAVAGNSKDHQNRIHLIWRSFILHHMCHAYIPLRCYGKEYRPFIWETAPIIKTIWFNEGFAQYIALHLLHRMNKIRIAKIKTTVDNAPAFINDMSLRELSELASTQYTNDFRIGQQTTARGILLANDLNNYIQEKSNNKKSLRDALIHLLAWSRKNKRAFAIEELPGIFQEATGVNVKPVFEKWMKPVTKIKVP